MPGINTPLHPGNWAQWTPQAGLVVDQPLDLNDFGDIAANSIADGEEATLEASVNVLKKRINNKDRPAQVTPQPDWYTRYENDNDAHARLHGCVLRYNGCPVNLIHYKNMWFSANPLLPQDAALIPAMVHAHDPALDVTSPPLGYAWDTKTCKAVYLSRRPARMWKDGLVSRNVFVELDDGTFGNFDKTDMIGVGQCIKDKYDPMTSVFETMINFESRPFSRDFCFSRSPRRDRVFLKFRGEVVGIIPFATRREMMEPTLFLIPTIKAEWISSRIKSHGLKIGG